MSSVLIHKNKDFVSGFDIRSGMYFRTGVMEKGHDTGVDPFMAPFPELLDVGIMGHCIHGKKGLCIKAGVQCYQDGLHSDSKNMSKDDFQCIVAQCKGKVYQIALGGCGDPDQHEDFEDFLDICKNAGIVPNYTTSGLGMTKKIAMITGKYCGAAAVSWYRSKYTEAAVDMLLEAGVKTNIHYVLSKSTVREAVDRLKNKSFPVGINAIVFLLHKPIGLGTMFEVLSAKDSAFRELVEITTGSNCSYKIGFDSCTVPAIIQSSGTVDVDSIDTCEAARWSAYITADMKMLPCSFDNQDRKWQVDLRRYSIEDAWLSDRFQEFRAYFHNACPNCKYRRQCMGGCPICPEIVPCERRFITVS